MTGRKSKLWEYGSLKDTRRLKYRNKATGEVKGYAMVSNGDITIRKVPYVESL